MEPMERLNIIADKLALKAESYASVRKPTGYTRMMANECAKAATDIYKAMAHIGGYRRAA